MPDCQHLDNFNQFRDRMNEIILDEAPLEVKRFFSLDSQAYRDGAIPVKTKELIGLGCSMVLRCDDCITYHLQQCAKQGLTDEEIWEGMSIALIIGGSVVMPHLRRAVDTLKTIRNAGSSSIEGKSTDGD
jgi:ribonuclease HI